MYEKIDQFIRTLRPDTISAKRRSLFNPLIAYIQGKVDTKRAIRLNFICTHNSRRSHLAQVWAQVMAYHFEIPKVFTYSGGTEATAMYPLVADVLKDQGFTIHTLSGGENPVYAVKYAPNELPVVAFSKTYDHAFNPQSDFAAIMTCAQADEGCPFIAGAEKRFPVTYDDPKAFDNTPQQAEKYRERSIQIATELHDVFSKVHLQ
jgi:arsenate reductase (thioredoxin)